MIPNEMKLVQNKEWLPVSIQSTLLGINVLLISQKIVNSYLLLSVGLIFSLFILQLISHRFLYFKPVNLFMQIKTPHIDTYMLYIFIYLSGVFLFLGLSQTYNIDILDSLNIQTKQYLLWVFVVLVIIMPLLFKLRGKNYIRNRITKKLKPASFKHIKNCEMCKIDALYEHVVKDWNDLRVIKKCNCGDGKPIETKTNLQIG